MNPRRIEFVAYLLGVMVLGLFHSQLKAALSGPVFLAVAIGYLVFVRVIGYFVARQVSKSSSSAGSGDA